MRTWIPDVATPQRTDWSYRRICCRNEDVCHHKTSSYTQLQMLARTHTQQQRRPRRSPSPSRRTSGCRLKQPSHFLQEPGRRTFSELCSRTWKRLTHLLRVDPAWRKVSCSSSHLHPPAPAGSLQLDVWQVWAGTASGEILLFRIMKTHKNGNNAAPLYSVYSLTGFYQ